MHLCRDAATTPRPNTLTPDLAVALGIRTRVLVGMNRFDHAEAAADKACGEYRQLSASEPDVFAFGLARRANDHGLPQPTGVPDYTAVRVSGKGLGYLLPGWHRS